MKIFTIQKKSGYLVTNQFQRNGSIKRIPAIICRNIFAALLFISFYTPYSQAQFANVETQVFSAGSNADNSLTFKGNAHDAIYTDNYGSQFTKMNFVDILEIQPEHATNRINNIHCVTVTIKNGEVPVVGLTVNINVTGANTFSGTGITNLNGQYEFCYLGTNIGCDVITATAISSGGVLLSEIANKCWNGPLGAPDDHSVLILGPTVTGGYGSHEALAAVRNGMTVEIVTPSQWVLKTAADFSTYRAIILGDPTCGFPTTPIAAAIASTNTWGPVINGNIGIFGTDPVYHYFQGGDKLINAMMDFVLADDPGRTKTGAYISLSCYYYDLCVSTPITLLDGLATYSGAFTMLGTCGLGCINTITLGPRPLQLIPLTDADLSNWSCSITEAFTGYPGGFVPIATGYLTSDASVMQEITYILAKGPGVPNGNITLYPYESENTVGENVTISAIVLNGGVPSVGKAVTFTVISGACSGVVGTSITNSDGTATFVYTCLTVGTDIIHATFENTLGHTETSNNIRAIWDNPLPVELSSFTSFISQRDVTLNWSTSSETNNSGFDIERSIVNGEWSKVSFVQGNGTTSTPNNYEFTDKNLPSGKYNYRLKQIDFNGNFEYFNLSNEVVIGVPDKFELSQNYPNPFNPSTKISYNLPFDGKVSLKVFDISGKEVMNLTNEIKTAGYYEVTMDGSNLSSGVYFYRLSVKGNSENFVATKKMMVLK